MGRTIPPPPGGGGCAHAVPSASPWPTPSRLPESQIECQLRKVSEKGGQIKGSKVERRGYALLDHSGRGLGPYVGDMRTALAIAIVLGFALLAVWRLEVLHDPSDAQSALEKGVNAVNFILLVLAGSVALIASAVSRSLRVAKLFEHADALNNETPRASAPSAKRVALASAPYDDAERGHLAAPASLAATPEPKHEKSTKHFLTHMKTFIIFIVVIHHISSNFANAGFDGFKTVDAEISMEGGKPSISVTSKNVFQLTTTWFASANQLYFMSALYFISGIFCPKSLDRKGFGDFVVDKLIRLGGPYVLYAAILNPALHLWGVSYAYGDQLGSRHCPVVWQFGSGAMWFVLWLLNFSILYAIVAQIPVPAIRFKMPNPVLLTVGGAVLGLLFCVLNTWIKPTWIGSLWVAFGVAEYLPFFTAGILAGRNGWLESIVTMPRWSRWVLRAYTLLFIIFLAPASLQVFGDWQASYWICALGGMYAVSMTLGQMQLFHQCMNLTTEFLGALGKASYMVYFIHPYVMNLWMMIFLEILKAAHVPIRFINNASMPWSTVFVRGTGFLDHTPAPLGQPMLWGGFAFVFVLTQLPIMALVTWPGVVGSDRYKRVEENLRAWQRPGEDKMTIQPYFFTFGNLGPKGL